MVFWTWVSLGATDHEAAEAVEVADCESDFRNDVESQGNLGTMQINFGSHTARSARVGMFWSDRPYTREDLLNPTDPLPNLFVAWDIWVENGRSFKGPWSCA